ncbi:MAG: DUF3822 family protein [Muribaculaceae bacterium]|nr:DUF3822 family protein [Muribaculaceae bacterium]
MQEVPLSKSLISDSEDRHLTLFVGRRIIYVSARSVTDGENAVLAAIPTDITAPSLTKAVQDAVYANPMLLLPFAKVTVIIDARRFFWIPAECADIASDTATAMGFDIGHTDCCLTASGDNINTLAMITESSLVNFIRRTFPDAVITHPAAVLVRYLARRSLTGSRGVHVDIGPENMTVAVSDTTGFTLCGSYRPTGVDSQTYYVIAAAKTAGVDPAETEFVLSGSPDARAALTQRLRQFAQQVMPAIVPTAAYPGIADIQQLPYTLLISPLCE